MVGEQVWRDYGSRSGVNYDSVILVGGVHQ